MLGPLVRRIGLKEGVLEALTGVRARRFWSEGTRPSEAAATVVRQLLDRRPIPACGVQAMVSTLGVQGLPRASHRQSGRGRRGDERAMRQLRRGPRLPRLHDRHAHRRQPHRARPDRVRRGGRRRGQPRGHPGDDPEAAPAGRRLPRVRREPRHPHARLDGGGCTAGAREARPERAPTPRRGDAGRHAPQSGCAWAPPPR